MGYGSSGYGDMGYGDMGYGFDGYGDMGYGDMGYGFDGYGDMGYGDMGYGFDSYGDMGYGDMGYGFDGYAPEPSMIEKLFERNEAGQFQLVYPESPAISFTDADDAAIGAYFERKMAEATALDMEFLEAYRSYESAIHQPWNDFLTKAEELTVRGIEMDAKTDQEIVTWVASNTFVDGESLYDKYPQV